MRKNAGMKKMFLLSVIFVFTGFVFPVFSVELVQNKNEETERTASKESVADEDAELVDNKKSEDAASQKGNLQSFTNKSEERLFEEEFRENITSQDIEKLENSKQRESHEAKPHDLTVEIEKNLSAEESEESVISQDMETIKVTGSRINRIDFEGPSPLTVWTKEDLDNSGYLSLSDFLKNTSIAPFGRVKIRNKNTLVLVNGKRFVFDNRVDLIPSAAIERVEILRDGASALYGSDVLGGVINIITKKDFNAPEFSLKIAPTLYPLYKGGSQMDFSFIFGKNFNKGHFVSTLQFQYHDSVKASDRKQWHNDWLMPYSPHPKFQTKEGLIVDSKCPENLKVKMGSTVIACNHDLLPYSHLFPSIYYLSNYNYAEYKIKGISFYTQWMGYLLRSAEPNQFIFKESITLPDGHKMSVGNGLGGKLIYFFEDIHSDQFTDNIFLDGLVGVKGYISKTWDFDLSLKWSNSWVNDKHTKLPYLSDIQNIIVSGLYDPFNPGVRDFSTVRLHDSVGREKSTKVFTSLDFSGETGFWDIDLALGLQAYYNKHKIYGDPKVKKGLIYGLMSSELPDLPSRKVFAAYAEAIKHFSDLLEVQAAWRIDHYSDFGWTANPKLAVYFKPSSHFSLRSSIGTSFKAPLLPDLYAPETATALAIYDVVACYNELKANGHFEEIYNSEMGKNFTSREIKDKMIRDFLIDQSEALKNKNLSKTGRVVLNQLSDKMGSQNYCRTTPFIGKEKGNKNLKPKKALTASFGFLLNLNEDHGLTADYWFMHSKGHVFPSLKGQGGKLATGAEIRYGKEYVERHGVQYDRDSNDPYNSIKHGTPVNTAINIGKVKSSGVELSWSSDFPKWSFANGNFYFRDTFSHLISSGVELFPGMGIMNSLGKYGVPEWRNFATFGWRNPKHNISLVLKSVAGVKKRNKESETLPISHIVDLFYQYNMDEKTSLGFGWYNLLFAEPILDDSIQQGRRFNQQLFDARGPRFFVELRKKL